MLIKYFELSLCVDGFFLLKIDGLGIEWNFKNFINTPEVDNNDKSVFECRTVGKVCGKTNKVTIVRLYLYICIYFYVYMDVLITIKC